MMLDHAGLGGLLQAKLTVSEPGDAYEQEADRVADEVMRMPDVRRDVVAGSAVHVERECSTCPERDEEGLEFAGEREDVLQVGAIDSSRAEPRFYRMAETDIVQRAPAPPQPLAVTLDASSDATILRGESCRLTGRASGGAGRYRYAWAASAAPVPAGAASSATVRPQATTTYTLTVTDRNSATASATTTVTVIESFTAAFSANPVCDGDPPVDYTLAATPAIPAVALPRIVAAMRVRMAPAVTWRGNPSGIRNLAVTRPNAALQGTVNRPLWYSTGGNHCNTSSDHVFEVFAPGRATNLTVAPNTLTVEATAGPGMCLDGSAGIVNMGNPASYFSGVPRYNRRVLPGGNTRVTAAAGSLRKSIQTTSTFVAPARSQYLNMVRAEEQFHERQIRGTAGAVIRDLWSVNRIIRNTNAAGPFEDPNPATAEAAATTAFNTAVADEINFSNNQAFSFANRRCRVEREAKVAVGASYRARMPCTYPMCP